ncbi:hexulose-6-phosphate isomerase [Rhodoblastus acidophilus]|uniref:sugar phosphate isomerase/epimerase family protein n=1 Tax=Rhodoblastus acidophilus TaxID=1074 RepID=UPI0022240486|nr:TIM barrel protein [Rhodoblastus acidophilus]MCW2316266.1 hexulose-6-phosphate isomerase [Rhodoblastus acidophilus]
MRKDIGFMQGRLSPRVDGKIQAFPVAHWREEFAVAERLGLSLMEWTIDRADFAANPLLTEQGRAEIRALQAAHGLRIESVTADNLMQAPFWKADGVLRRELLDALAVFIRACSAVGVKFIVAPLVDNGSLVSPQQEDDLFDGLMSLLPLMQASNVAVIFESDYAPERLRNFIARYPENWFGINFDMGNSAALGWPPAVEIPALASRIMNVHVKDRPLRGTTVPFGEGAVDFDAVFRLLRASGYAGNYILQGARARDDDHAGAITRYAQLVESRLNV